MNKALAIAAAAALLAAPAYAQSVPLNTLSGGEGQEQVAGQAELLGLGVAGTTAAAVVVTTLVLVAVAAEESSTTTP